MKLSLDCVPCMLNSYIRLVESINLDKDLREKGLKEVLRFLHEADYTLSPPVLGKEMHRNLRKFLNDPDPYKKIKDKYNKLLSAEYDKFKMIAEKSEDSFNTAVRLALAGNAADFGSKHMFELDPVIEKALLGDLRIDDSGKLKAEIEKAGSLLYIGDNAGEIVLDKLLLEIIDHDNAVFVVRGGPVINDATKEDAETTGIDKFAEIITTGDDAPGAFPDSSSDEFNELLESSGVVIAKGQGNLEGLCEVEREIFFILVIKCDIVAAMTGTEPGDLVVMSSSRLRNNS